MPARTKKAQEEFKRKQDLKKRIKKLNPQVSSTMLTRAKGRQKLALRKKEAGRSTGSNVKVAPSGRPSSLAASKKKRGITAKSQLMAASPYTKSKKKKKGTKQLDEITVEGISVYTDEPGRLSRLFKKRLGGEIRSKGKKTKKKDVPGSKSRAFRKRLGGY